MSPVYSRNKSDHGIKLKKKKNGKEKLPCPEDQIVVAPSSYPDAYLNSHQPDNSLT